MTLSLQIPDSLHHRVRIHSDEDGVSIDQFIALAVAEKLSALDTVTWLEERAARGREEDWNAILDTAPDVEPEAHDRLPEGSRRET